MNEADKKRLFEQMYQAVLYERKCVKKQNAACHRASILFCEIEDAGLSDEYLEWKREYTEAGRRKS